MNTIYIRILFVAFIVLFPVNSFSSENNTDSNNIEISLGTGPSININKLSKKQIDDINLYFNFRTMWKPNRILNIGLEAAYLDLISESRNGVQTEFGTTDYSAELFAYPVNILLSMEIGNFNLSAGAGFAVSCSKITAFNETVSSSVITGNYTYGVSYNLDILENFLTQIELKGYFIPTINKYAVTAVLSIGYEILSW